MNDVISNVLRYGVLLSAAIITIGTVLLAARSGGTGIAGFLTYNADTVPHGTFSVNMAALPAGLAALDPLSVIELGVLVLLATPVSRVLFSVLLFMAEGDRTYVYVTAAVLILLLFSMLATPFIPAFNG